jgi:hypothetical protein
MSRIVDWSRLVRLGVPLLQRSSGRHPPPDKPALASVLGRLRPTHADLPEGSRECSALTAWLLALKDHYPGFWQQHGAHLDRWLRRQPVGGAEIKLRRIALAYLASYL